MPSDGRIFLQKKRQRKKRAATSANTSPGYGAIASTPLLIRPEEYNNVSLSINIPPSIPFLSKSDETLFRDVFKKSFEKKMNAYKEEALHGSVLEGWQKLSVDLSCGALTAGAIAAQAYEDEANIINSFLLFSVVGTIVEYIIKPLMIHGYSRWNQRKANEISEASYFLRKNFFLKSDFLNKFVDEFCIRYQDKFQSLASGGGLDVVMERLAKEVVDALFNAILKYFQVNKSVLERAIIQDREVGELITNLLENISI